MGLALFRGKPTAPMAGLSQVKSNGVLKFLGTWEISFDPPLSCHVDAV